MNKTKSFDIPKKLVYEAYKAIKRNKGAAGIDGESIADFELNLKNNLYKLWNRMSSGTYLPPAVKTVDIPKKSGVLMANPKHTGKEKSNPKVGLSLLFFYFVTVCW